MKKILFTLLFYFIFLIKSFALIEVDITRGNLDPLPIAVSPLHVDVKSDNFKDLKVKEPVSYTHLTLPTILLV